MFAKRLKTSSPINNLRLFISSCAFLSFSSMAEQQSAFLDMSLEELGHVSVASLFDETTLEASSSVMAITESDWQENGAKRTNELMAYQPSSVPYLFLGGSNVFAVRGFANSLSSRGMATMLDGVPLNTYSYGTAQYFLSNFDLGALQRAEMIRGPGSSIYGSDAFHGVFSLSTFDSKNDVVETNLGLGSSKYARGYARFSQNINDNQRIQGAVATTYESDAGVSFLTSDPNINGERKDKYHSRTAFLKSNIKLNQYWGADWGLYFNDFNGENFPSFGEGGLGEDDISDNKQKFYMLKMATNYKVDSHTSVELKTFLWNADQEFMYEFVPIPVQAQEDRRIGASITVKHQNENSGLRWLLGTGVDRTKIVSAITAPFLPSFEGLERNIKNIFGEVRVPLMEQKLFINVAARIDDYTNFDSSVTPRLGLVYLLDKNESIKVLYGNAFRAPAASEVTSSGNIQGNPNLEPETIDTYEIIWMMQKNNGAFTATMFLSKWKEGIAIIEDSTLPGGFTSKYENQGALTSKGLELEASYLHNNWEVKSAYSYNESKDDKTEEEFLAFPKHIIQLGLKHAFTNGVEVKFNNIIYHDMHESPLATSEELGTIWQSNLHVEYEYNRHVNMSFDIRDAFNRKDNIPSLWGNAEGLPVDSAQYSAYLRYKF